MKVKTDLRDVTVEKLPLREYAKLLDGVEFIPQAINDLSVVKSDDVLGYLPKLIGKAFPDFVNIVVIGSDLTSDEVEQLDLGDFTEIIVAIYEVNNLQKVFTNLKKLFARNQTIPSKTSAGSTGQ